MRTTDAGGAIHSKDTALNINNGIKFENVVSDQENPLDLTETDLGRCAENDQEGVSDEAYTVIQLECSNK